MLRAREHTPTPYSIVFTFELAFDYFKEFGVRQFIYERRLYLCYIEILQTITPLVVL
jgi:hypothetical protein